MNGDTSFNERCYALLKLIPEGKVTTYKEMADALGTKAWRAVGSAMAKNEHLLVIPCHRVVRSDGTIGEYALGADKKAELLALARLASQVMSIGEASHPCPDMIIRQPELCRKEQENGNR